jgi:hypothetical protein
MQQLRRAAKGKKVKKKKVKKVIPIPSDEIQEE